MKPRRERDADLIRDALVPAVPALGSALGPHVEVVLHDLRIPERSIVAISNGHLTGRSIGDAIIAGPLGDKGFNLLNRSGEGAQDAPAHTLENYVTRSRDGRPLRSTTTVFFDDQGRPYAALCVNVDIGAFENLRALLSTICDPAKGSDGERESPDETRKVGDLTSEIIGEALQSVSRPVNLMSKTDRLSAVRTMEARGLFLIKGTVEQVAQALDVSRFTIYNYLDEIRGRIAFQEKIAPNKGSRVREQGEGSRTRHL